MMMSSRRAAALAALLMAALALFASASADVTYTAVARGKVVPSSDPLDDVFFGEDEEDAEDEVEEAAVVEEDEGEVVAQASCKSIKKPSGRGKKPSSSGGKSKKMAEKFYREAKKYGSKAKIILIGDSIVEQLEDKSSCEKRIFKSFKGKGLNWGISGIKSDFIADMVHWIFRGNEGDLTPQVVYIAVGVNDCRNKKDEDDIVDNIEDAVEAIKYYSPDTQVVIQGILPTSDKDKDKDDFEGEDFKDFKLYDCISDVNKDLERYAKKYKSRCVSFHDAEDVVLDDGEFRKDVLKDGLHFDKDEMKDYCKEIEGSVKKYKNLKVNSAGGNPFANWTDAEPLHYPEVEGNETLYRWRYNDWSTCTGACGLQRRTAECHAVDVATGSSATVEEILCTNSFMNPLERVCDLQPDCEARLGPLGALLRFPISAGDVQAAEAEEEELKCGMDVVYMSLTAALAAALVLAVTALAVVWTVSFKRRAAREAGAPAQAQAEAEEDLKAAAPATADAGPRL